MTVSLLRRDSLFVCLCLCVKSFGFSFNVFFKCDKYCTCADVCLFVCVPLLISPCPTMFLFLCLIVFLSASLSLRAFVTASVYLSVSVEGEGIADLRSEGEKN